MWTDAELAAALFVFALIVVAVIIAPNKPKPPFPLGGTKPHDDD